ncbi:Oidioi.mRNA.OKI2018_I69.chr2.g6938.t1.cds [Oikopleura dioica]|uniref:Oidioi.mRNA.OKI2018_I69.chr2.g6938.t1.cds n=1 Tax=Oikopleura dioica TaxID=34765 RepID=A0ABN7T836_OIKDI|nr:Oidioi.mRNA.OKI2018_I69.chr2.g6938.t1.cds [Oikopleura dioica]
MNTKEFRTNAVGTLEFQGTGEGDKAQFIRLSDSTSGANVHRLLTKEWQMELPKLVITVHGSEKRLDLTAGQRQLLISGLIKATRTTDAWIMSIGLSSEGGIGELVGQALTEHQLYARGRVSAIGVMPWGVVDNRDDLQNDDKLKTGAVPYQTMADPLSKGAVLNAAHTHFLMVDNGSVGKWRTEIRFRRAIEKELVKKHNVPMVCLIIEGDRTTLETVLKKVMEGIPVVVCVPAQKNESIRNAADLIAYAYHLSDSKGDISKENRAQMEELLTSHKNADQFNRGTILNLTRMMSFKRLIKIFWMDLHGTDNVATRNLDYAILTSLFSTSAEKKKTDPDNWLKMAMSWDRPDIARSHVFAFPYAKNFPVGSLRKRLEEALVNDKVEFVKLFMDHGVSMHKFLTIKRLEDLYNADKPDYLPQHLKYLLDDVSREKRVPKGARRINLIQIGLVIEGLMGGTYRSNYTRKKFHLYYKQTESQTSNNENFKNPFHELLIWAVLMKRQEMAIFMWQKGEEAMAKALIAMKLYRRMAQEADDDDLNQEEIETMRLYSDQFKQKALDILKLGYKDSDKMCYQLLTYELKSWSRHTCLSLAVLAQHRDLIAHPCVQNIITDLWMGALDIRRNSNIKVPISLVTLWPLFTTILHPFPSFRNVIQFIKFKTSEQLREIPKTLQEYLDECEDDHGFSTRHNETSTTSSTSSTSSSDEEKRFGSRNIASEEKSSLVTSAGARRDQFSRGCIRGSNGTQSTKDADQKVHFLLEPSATQEHPPEPIFTSKMVLTPETPGSNDLGLTRKIYEYFNAPITKYWFNIIMYVVFILSISYTVLVRMCPWTIPDVEWFVVSYVVTFAIENIRSISISTSRGVWSKFRHWHSKFWNLLETFAIITFLFGFGLRLQVFTDKETLGGNETSCGEFYERALSKNSSDELRKAYEELAYGRVLCVTSVVLWWIRILKFLSVHKTIGPYITMAGKMLIDMSSFITILAVVLISFGLSRQSIIHDRSESLTWQTIWGVFHKPYFMLYGEVYAPEIDPYYDDSGDLIPGVNPGAWVVPVFNTLYLLVANILLINLLIAVFNNTFARVKVESHQIWACQRYEVIMQYEAHPIFPPPFIFISHLKMLIDKIFCSKTKGKFEADRGLKLFLADFEEENLHDWEEELIDDYERMKRRKMFISNESVSDEYMVDWGERLGCGMNGSVRSAKSRSTGDDYAVKVIRDRPRARAEVEMHSTVMGHENVVQLHEVFCNELKFPGESDATAKLILIMEKMKEKQSKQQNKLYKLSIIFMLSIMSRIVISSQKTFSTSIKPKTQF